MGGGGGGSAPFQPPSNRALSAIARFNGVVQEEQQQFQPVQGGFACEKCTDLRIPYSGPLQARETLFVRMPVIIWALTAVIM